MILFFDTETTGLVNFTLPANHSTQPRMVQLAALLTDKEGNDVASMSCIVKPNGFTIPPNMVHGISHEYAMERGMDISAVMGMWLQLMAKASTIVGFNVKFDQMVILNELWQHNAGYNIDYFQETYCVMLESTERCAIPHPKWKNRYKWPKLAEAYKIICGKTLEGAHDALNDIRATKEIFFELNAVNSTTD